MYGAILGDVVGSRYEFDRSPKIKEFGPLFTDECEFTDDTVMTVAVAEALLTSGKDADIDTIRKNLIVSMKKWGHRYPNAGYGGRFFHWLFCDDEEPYYSYGNGSAMRVSAAGWLYDSLERTLEVAEATADVTHNHPEGIKGARAIAAAIYMARSGSSKQEIKEYIENETDYDFSRTLDEIRPAYTHIESCQKTVPEALTAFFESESFEDAVRNAVSLGGDCDTLTDITAAVAEAYYGISDGLKRETEGYLESDMLEVLDSFGKQKQ